MLETDPAVDSAGFDAGYAPEANTLRAPGLSVGNVPDAPGWIRGVPPLAVEYASVGQDEAELQSKIADLLQRGTRFLWVVRLIGPRRVEVYEPGNSMRTKVVGEVLEAPGVLKNAVPVEALFDREAAHRSTLRNLLQREGYESLDAVRDEGHDEGALEGRRHALALLLRQRFGDLPDSVVRALEAADGAALDAALARVLTAATPHEVLG